MHHHHPPLPITTTAAVSANANGAVAAPPLPQQQRRRKKRPNYGTRIVEVRRGYNGFGFTISGQQPCRLSCIIADSPAEQAGLRSGDFLISVNGLNVSKLPHETVVQLIGNSFGSIRMQIAENYYSDSSDEENANATLMQQQSARGLLASVSNGFRAKPRFMHHKTKMHRLRNSPQKKRFDNEAKAHSQPQSLPLQATLQQAQSIERLDEQTLRPVMEDLPLPPVVKSPAKPVPQVASVGSADVANVSAMVRVVASTALEYRAIVGYLGTIEMPKQISHSSKLQTVRSCIRKLRQEKRQPTIVLMSILPDCLRLQSANGNLLASYASSRLNYVSSSSESENRFFGLVTSAVHNTQIEEEYELEPTDDKSTTGHISISHSCHVFVIDTKLIDHQQHLQRACEFRIQCTRDPISSLCLEFPNNSEYVVNLIRSMYTMRILPPATRSISNDYDAVAMGAGIAAKPPVVGGLRGAAAHSPQPSNHSEISTTTSNSDSGIGFNNDCTNISDRILVVDFAGAAGPLVAHAAVGNVQVAAALPQQSNQRPARPLGICCDAISTNDKRLTVRAMPDPKSPQALRRPNLLANFNLIKSPASSLTATRSCDDVLNLIDRTSSAEDNDVQLLPPHASMDDISLHASNASTPGLTAAESYTFLHPSAVLLSESKGRMRHSLQPVLMMTTTAAAPAPASVSSTHHKLSPQVFIGNIAASAAPQTKSRHSLGFQAIDVTHKSSATKHNTINLDSMDTWSSLQNIHAASATHAQAAKNCQLEATFSEPDLGNRALPANASPFRRAWGQSSFRTPRTDKLSTKQQQEQQQRAIGSGSPLVRRTASMTASDNDVYKTSMGSKGNNNVYGGGAGSGGNYIDELKQTTRSQQQLGMMQVPQIRTELVVGEPTDDDVGAVAPSGVSAWGASFERMLQESAGMQTFSEFLKKEFSAENIYFWTACERYRQLENEAERVALAHEIFNKHLSNTGTDPVNVDSQARNLSEEKLQSGARDIFAPAQKQIFNLMKFDSYQRFIRSELYKSCVEASEKQQPLPYSGEDLDDLLKTNFHVPASSTKLKKSASNAEDRRRKSLLPWHRKTRSKSRDRNELLSETSAFNAFMPASIAAGGTQVAKLSALSSSSLKIASTQNSLSDLHSSRSSLSSFDAAGANSLSAEAVCSLCRVILSDGATTIVQTRADETVAQLVERLLEKRGLSYQYYDVVFNGCNKSIDMQLPSHTLAGKEVLIEQRVAFKLDLPDPKVISVKSKPKKQLHEVIRPILHKYNYSMSGVQVLLRDTQEQLDLMQSVTVVDGQRLQIVLAQQLAQDFQQSGGSILPPKFLKTATGHNQHNNIPPALAKRAAGIAALRNGTTTQTVNAVAAQSTLDEITNKVFNELLQGKVEATAAASTATDDKQRPSDVSSVKSEDCGSENSSIFDRMRRRDSTNIPGSKLPKFKKKSSTSSQHSQSDELPTNTNAQISAVNTDPKKPIIAKLKAGVKLQVTERVVENQDELLEGLKRAQLARLEDQRGTEINFELPDFLKNKENISAAASKLRKVRASLSPINAKPLPTTSTSTSLPATSAATTAIATSNSAPNTPTVVLDAPQPAPRLSITLKQNKTSISPMKVDEEPSDNEHNDATASINSMDYSILHAVKGPPPLPPKPKVLPIKPSNWGATTTTTNSNTSALTKSTFSNTPIALPSITNKIPNEIGRKSLLLTGIEPPPARCAYLDEPSSSFV